MHILNRNAFFLKHYRKLATLDRMVLKYAYKGGCCNEKIK